MDVDNSACTSLGCILRQGVTDNNEDDNDVWLWYMMIILIMFMIILMIIMVIIIMILVIPMTDFLYKECPWFILHRISNIKSCLVSVICRIINAITKWYKHKFMVAWNWNTWMIPCNFITEVIHSKRGYKNIVRHTAHTIVSWPNPKQWLMIHTSGLMMIIR